ncbi:MAG: tRNA 2-thiouridine(34) synthase MnmA [Ruminococcaceae bacterium]|nr:tRNA 2-thiouridine(34) synthase MnmA [Oscillospiraceae bacterium]
MDGKKRILIAMSGGVDSAVAAMMIKQSGATCAGANMRLHNKTDAEGACGSGEDAADAEKVASALNIPFFALDFSSDFEKNVILPFVTAYENGRTPNPCIECNRFLKFDRFLKEALSRGFTHIATGHYARIDFDASRNRYLLKKAADLTKDQSYVLWTIRQEQLAHILFPLGDMTKAEARQLAEESGLAVAHKSDSQDICFVPDGKYADFVERYRGTTFPAGEFRAQDGRVLGYHRGIIRYTIGQKKGLGLVLPEPLYVSAIHAEDNSITLSPSEGLFSTTLTATHINLISVPRIEGAVRLKAKVRYRHTEEWATVTQPTPDTLRVEFDQPQRAITKGQSVVLYDGDVVVGGGIIS